MSRWAEGVIHHDEEARSFIAQYFKDPKRTVLLVAAAGFDPRSTTVAKLVCEAGNVAHGIFIREERPNPHADLMQRASANVTTLQALVSASTVVPIDIFDPQDGAVVGAKRLIRELAPKIEQLQPVTDIVLDLSALSIGIAFPLVRHVYDVYGDRTPRVNIHLFVAEDPDLDAGIVPDHTDQPMYVPGFSGGAGLEGNAGAAKLWIPQLVAKRQVALQRIHDFVRAEETCPILPFPARRLRGADELLEQFMAEVVDAWEVDPRNYVYAAEREPLDLYRTLVKIDDARKKVYKEHGGSLIILSPIGSKVLALGALLAALERNLPVAYLESVGFALAATAEPDPKTWAVVHVWLAGDVYPLPASG